MSEYKGSATCANATRRHGLSDASVLEAEGQEIEDQSRRMR